MGIRLSDTNVYWYSAYELLQGKILYKDIFFTNLPLFPYVASIYFFLSRGELTYFFFTSAIEVCVTTSIIYFIVFEQTKRVFISVATASLYCFSFIVLATTDHQTGVFLASLFAVISYYWYTKKRFIFVGIFTALALLTKGYFIPLFVTYLIMLGLTTSPKLHNKFPFVSLIPFVSFITSFLITLFLILLPSLLFAPKEMYQDLFAYSLTRPEGVPKLPVFWFFIIHDIALFFMFAYSLISYKTNKFFSLFCIFSILFLFFYRDIYYLYLNLLVPFLCLLLPNFLQAVEKRFSVRPVVPFGIICLFLFFGLLTYQSSFSDVQKVPDPQSIVKAIKQVAPQVLYGAPDIAPAFAYLTNTKLLNNIIDTNENMMRTGVLDREKLQKDAIKQHALVLTHGAQYPEFGINERIIDGMYDKEVITKNCKFIKGFPVRQEGGGNRVNLFKC